MLDHGRTECKRGLRQVVDTALGGILMDLRAGGNAVVNENDLAAAGVVGRSQQHALGIDVANSARL